MSSTRKAWLVAASIGVVEALKDQAGFCRWNYALRLVQHHAKSNLRFYTTHESTQPNKLPASTTAVSSKKMMMMMMKSTEKLKRLPEEESLRNVMYLSSWGPYS